MEILRRVIAAVRNFLYVMKCFYNRRSEKVNIS